MAIIWELDFYSRPVLDENQKKIWELLICNSYDADRPERFEWIKVCHSSEVNSSWLAAELKEAIAAHLQQTGETPQKVRFYRPSMTNIISRGCKQVGLIPQISRRLFTISPWLQDRMQTVYPHREGFVAAEPQPLPLRIGSQVPTAQPAPDALMGESWMVASLKIAEFSEASSWSMDFGELFSLDFANQSDQVIPGLIITSTRALALAAWMSGVDPVFLKFEPNLDKLQLILEAGEEARWILTNLNRFKNMGAIAQAEDFEAAKKASGGIHFVAIQTDPAIEHFAGFWLLKEI